MNRKFPIYTIENECNDCYKCVRNCPVKSIRIEHGRASVVPELCVSCGHCVEVCPVEAKRIRDDLGRAKHLLKRKEAVYLSLAPSWVSEFDGVSSERMATAIKRLGFAGVSETALGAQQVSAAVSKMLAEEGPRLAISTACPVCVSFIQKYRPSLTPFLTPLLSPALTHARMLRQAFGPAIGVVFVGPCIAKKEEADRRGELMDLALTFADLRKWLEEEKIEAAKIEPASEAAFALGMAAEGALYPIEGGMSETIKAYGEAAGADFVTLSGMSAVAKGLDNLRPDDLDRRTFIECLACEGGCIGGPGRAQDRNPIWGRDRTLRFAKGRDVFSRQEPGVELAEKYERKFLATRAFSPHDLQAALARVGKSNAGDELNCGGCGYDTCRKFAQALLEGKAEPAMCASYMRRQAMSKANALLRCMPCGGVIVNKDLTIVESNEAFAQLFGEDTVTAFEASDGLAGAHLESVLPFSDLFVEALRSCEDVRREHLAVGGRMMNVTIFTIEPQQTVGAIVEDVTQTELRRERIAKKAREVIQRNITTVQDIACRLGEHMADTEILMRSIADDYAVRKDGEDDDEESEEAPR